MSCTRSNPPNGYTAENRTSITLQNRTTSPALERAMVTIAHQDNVHKPNCPLRPIVNNRPSPTYALSKWLAQQLKIYQYFNENEIINSYEFKEDIIDMKLNGNQRIISLDVESMFTSIPIPTIMDALNHVRLFIFEILFIIGDEILNKNFDDDSENEDYSLNESSEWNKNHAIIGRTRSHNIITHLPSLKGPAKPKPNCDIDIFNLFYTAAIIKQISEFTNAKIEEFRQRISELTKSTYSNFTSEIEIRAFLGLLYLAGVYKSGHENVESLFASDGTGREIFHSVMSVKRFLFLLLCIRFDNFKTRCKEDRLSPIRDIFQTIIENFQSCYTLAEYLTVDEMLVGFRGKCPFKIYIPSKPNKYGIKIVILADSRTHYMYNVKRTIPANPNIERTWPYIFRNDDKEQASDSTTISTAPQKRIRNIYFWFLWNNNFSLHVPKKRKSVILISSMHHDDKCDETTGKPDIIMDYNLTKGGVDTIDQMVSNFSTSRRSRRWPSALFYALLDITALNSYIIFNYQIDKKDQKERSTFIGDLGRALFDEHLATRNLNPSHWNYRRQKKKFKKNDGSNTSRGSMMPQKSDTPKRCYKCPSKNAVQLSHRPMLLDLTPPVSSQAPACLWASHKPMVGVIITIFMLNTSSTTSPEPFPS
ncbi:hypothetical protein LAZ67_6002305 [Cordylochernes scorpioides]|uniref:PiggyBac transposable element-derived protein domain-containing protein n=1 Tax=Cordylochernes scorpioides TaxID=51811 RepID=A0ABY6KL18_9ARAC|nr:hypothetical protein LAZ67_6002305 [Cordylochernes scorpioides]